MKLSPGEKLITVLLCDLLEHLEAHSEFDPALIKDAIFRGHLWALDRKYSGLTSAEDTPEEVVKETTDILAMWSILEDAFKALPEGEQRKVAESDAATGGTVRFHGFDGNNEIDHMSTARFMIEKLGQFEKFAGRDLNCHSESLDGHRRMYSAFEPIVYSGGHESWRLSAEQLIQVLSERRHPRTRG